MTGDLPADLVEQLRQASLVAMDTETSGLDWRRDTLELCQFYAHSVGPVLVRRSEVRPTHLLELLEDPGVTKVFHYAPFDLRFLGSTWGVRTNRVFCTKAASKLLDPHAAAGAHSLGAL